MTIEEASEKYCIPIKILKEYPTEILTYDFFIFFYWLLIKKDF